MTAPVNECRPNPASEYDCSLSEAGPLPGNATAHHHVRRVLLPGRPVSRGAEVLPDNMRPRLQQTLLIGRAQH